MTDPAILTLSEVRAAERRRAEETADVHATLATAATHLPREYMPTLADRFERARHANEPGVVRSPRGNFTKWPPVEVRRGDIARAVAKLVVDEHEAGRLPRVVGGAL